VGVAGGEAALGASPLDQTPPILASLRVAQRTKAHHERNKERGERTLREKQAWGLFGRSRLGQQDVVKGGSRQ
jgi:hypothetical protein